MKRFAFLIMGDEFSAEDRASIHSGTCQIIGVHNLEDACEVAKQLVRDGVECIEVCGAFKEKGCRTLVEATGGTVPIGYVTRLPEQEELFIKTFGN